MTKCIIRSNIKMKKLITLFLLISLFIISKSAEAQLGVGTITPDGSSILDLASTTKGLLAPRMTSVARNAIALPATGLLVFDITVNAFEVNTGTPASPFWSVLGTTGALVSNSRTINTNLPLSGGGNLSADRTLSIDTTTAGGVATKNDLVSKISLASLSANAPVIYNNSNGVIRVDTSAGAVNLATQGFVTRQGYLTANQTLTLSGDVTGSGTTSIATTIANNAVTTSKILDANVSYAKIQNISA